MKVGALEIAIRRIRSADGLSEGSAIQDHLIGSGPGFTNGGDPDSGAVMDRALVFTDAAAGAEFRVQIGPLETAALPVSRLDLFPLKPDGFR